MFGLKEEKNKNQTKDIITEEIGRETTSKSISAEILEKDNKTDISNVNQEKHICNGECKHEEVKSENQVNQEPPKQPSLTYKEIRALKKSKYDEIQYNYDTAYVLGNKKTKMIVEIRASSSFQACNFIGWKPNQVILIETKNLKKEVEKIEKEQEEFIKNERN